MDTSPKGRWIAHLDGDADAIIARADEISRLGGQMSSASVFLKGLVDETSQQQGKAVEKLREVVGDTYEKLAQAGEMYTPTGPVLRDYGRSLADVQPLVNAAYRNCVDLWDDFQATPGYRLDARPWWAQPKDDDADEADQAHDDDVSKEAAYDAWHDEAVVWDRHVDTWEDAFDAAAAGIGDVLEGKIKDGFWDNVDGFVGGVLTVLQVVGIIIAVAAIIIGGPIVALIGAVVGVLTLALTAYQYIRGDTGLGQLILAVVAVIPVGSLGKLFQGSAGRLAFLGDAFTAFRPSAWSAAFSQGRTLSLVGSLAGGGWKGAASIGKGLFQMNNPNGVGDVMSRLIFGTDTAGFTEMTDALSGGVNGFCRSTVIPAAFEFAHTVITGPISFADKIATWTGHGEDALGSKYPWIGALT